MCNYTIISMPAYMKGLIIKQDTFYLNLQKKLHHEISLIWCKIEIYSISSELNALEKLLEYLKSFTC